MPPDGGTQFWCEVLECLLSDRVIGAKLREQLLDLGLDLRAFARCLSKHCIDANPPKDGCSTSTVTLGPDEIRTLVERVVSELRGG